MALRPVMIYMALATFHVTNGERVHASVRALPDLRSCACVVCVCVCVRVCIVCVCMLFSSVKVKSK